MQNHVSADNEQALAQSLFEKQQKIYPREVHGIFALLRTTAGGVLLGIFFILPWVTWNDRPCVLFDLPARKFYVFGWTLWPQDFLLLALLLAIAAIALFFFTALAGRLWCGYACPQTVWTDLFLAVERKIEGTARAQMKRDNSPMSWQTLRKKTLKHSIWLLIAVFTGFTFVAYFSPASDLAAKLVTFNLNGWEFFWIAFYTVATYGNAGWMREQVCKYMCPYARFQSAMFDNDTLIISYDKERGEPRGSRKVGVDPASLNLGDCINCTLCVQVCPTGIDIRQGLQYECIGCSACIDVCNDVMGKMGYARNLIRYTTQNALDGKVSRILRPRIFVYATMLAALSVLLFYALVVREPIALDVIRDRNQLYREVQGKIENIYTLKIVNMDDQAHEYAVTASGFTNIEVIVETENIQVAAGSVANIPVRVRGDESELTARSTVIQFSISAQDDSTLYATESARFLGPIP